LVNDAADDDTDGSCDVVISGMTTLVAGEMTTGGTCEARPGAALKVIRSEYKDS
jgi:hypothetical protein